MREKKLQNLVERMASMLVDLHENYSWDELGDNLEDVLEEARELDCDVEEEN